MDSLNCTEIVNEDFQIPNYVTAEAVKINEVHDFENSEGFYLTSLDAPIILNAPKSIYENDKVAVENNTNRFLPYSRAYPSSSTSTSTQSHTKYGFYKPMQWTKETVLELLCSTNDGRFIIADEQSHNGYLTDDGQNMLTKLLINYLFQDQCKGTDLFFRNIAKIITEIFPNELESVYFIPANQEGQSHAKGKLIERWKNVSRRLRKVGALESQKKKLDDSTGTLIPYVFSDEVKLAKEWLSNDGLNASFNVIFKKWEITYELRCAEIQNNLNLSDVFELWPILQNPRGYELVEKDFELQYPNREEFKDWNIFLRNWTCFTRSIVNIRRGSVKDKHALQLLSQLDSAELNKEYRTINIIRLLLLPYLIPTKTQIKNPKINAAKKFWKPSLEESASAFVTHVTNLTTLEHSISRRRRNYMEHGATIQPFLIIVGKTLSDIENSYIQVNDQLWSTNCPLKALSICFKTYFSFNCSYPRECYETWLLIQIHVFNLKTKYDKPTAITNTWSKKLDALQ